MAWPNRKPTNGTVVDSKNSSSSLRFFDELFAYTEEAGSELDLDALDVVEVSGRPENAVVTQRLYTKIRAYALEGVEA